MEVQRCAVRWTAAETADVETDVRWREVVSEPGGVGQVCSAALECCSEPKTPGGVRPLTLQKFHLESKGTTKFSSFIFPRAFSSAG